MSAFLQRIIIKALFPAVLALVALPAAGQQGCGWCPAEGGGGGILILTSGFTVGTGGFGSTVPNHALAVSCPRRPREIAAPTDLGLGSAFGWNPINLPGLPCDQQVFDQEAPNFPFQCNDGLGACALTGNAKTVDVRFFVAYRAPVTGGASLTLRMASPLDTVVREYQIWVLAGSVIRAVDVHGLVPSNRVEDDYDIQVEIKAPACSTGTGYKGEIENYNLRVGLTQCGAPRAWLTPLGATPFYDDSCESPACTGPVPFAAEQPKEEGTGK